MSDVIVAAERKIDPYLAEKDYWLMHCLYGLKKSGYDFQLKGGTSLSKGYGIIHRFSEDIDIAIIGESQKSGNEIKQLIRSAEKEMTKDLKELNVEGVTSKGSRFRKSFFE